MDENRERKTVTISLYEDALSALNKLGISSRKRGEYISELVLTHYTQIGNEKPNDEFDNIGTLERIEAKIDKLLTRKESESNQ